MDRSVTVKVYKYNGKLHYEWEANILEAREEYILLKGNPGRTLVHHSRKKSFIYTNYSIEFFPLNDFYTVNIDIEKDGTCTYYCNICLLPHYQSPNLTFIDLDLDYIRNKSGKWQVVDEIDFEKNRIEMYYPEELVEKAKNALEDLKIKIELSSFPFDGFLENQIKKVIEDGR